MAEATPKKSNSTIWIIAGIGAVILLLFSCCGCCCIASMASNGFSDYSFDSTGTDFDDPFENFPD